MFFRRQKANGNDNRSGTVQPTHIGPDSTIDGNVAVEDEIRIEGSIRGMVKARKCVVMPGGVVEGEVNADDVVVHGRVIGPVIAVHVHLQAGARVEGDITSDTIAIETGARLSGAVWQTGGAEEAEPQSTRALGYDEPTALFSDPLWDPRRDDAFRPLKAVRPRASNGSRS